MVPTTRIEIGSTASIRGNRGTANRLEREAGPETWGPDLLAATQTIGEICRQYARRFDLPSAGFDDVDDFEHEALVHLWGKLPFPPEAGRAWFATVITRFLIDRYRQRGRGEGRFGQVPLCVVSRIRIV